jgi:HK97 gp10 family phage protein
VITPISVVIRANKIPALDAAARARVLEAIRRTAFAIERDAKENAPVDTGALKNSIQALILPPNAAEVSVGVEYGIYVEYGTHHQRAQPYLGPAAIKHAEEFAQRMQDIYNGK